MEDHNMGKVAVVILVVICFFIEAQGHSNLCYARATQSGNAFDTGGGHGINFAGPPRAIRPQVPNGSGFWSFAICVPNVISRSGQPSMAEFRWLKEHGWKSVVNLRISSDVARWPGFKDLNLNYLALPIRDDSVPSDKQAREFLEFVTSPYNQPVHIYCHAGVGRTGVMVALYRYMIQGWPMDRAISESRLFDGGLNKIQKDWLKDWAHKHTSGSFSKQQQPKVS